MSDIIHKLLQIFVLNPDASVNAFFSSHASTNLLVLMNVITDVLSPESFLIVSLLGVVYFLFKKQWKPAVITFCAIGGGFVIAKLIKEIVMRARPLDSWLVETGYSFPSGHAVAATVFFTLIIYFFAYKIKSPFWRSFFVIISILLIILTAVSRLYLGVHWLSDVIAGGVLGLLWTIIVISVVRRVVMNAERPKERKEN